MGRPSRFGSLSFSCSNSWLEALFIITLKGKDATQSRAWWCNSAFSGGRKSPEGTWPASLVSYSRVVLHAIKLFSRFFEPSHSILSLFRLSVRSLVRFFSLALLTSLQSVSGTYFSIPAHTSGRRSMDHKLARKPSQTIVPGNEAKLLTIFQTTTVHFYMDESARLAFVIPPLFPLEITLKAVKGLPLGFNKQEQNSEQIRVSTSLPPFFYLDQSLAISLNCFQFILFIREMHLRPA